jgi:hypothetical protein
MCSSERARHAHGLGCAKGLHQAPCEREIVESLLVATATTRTDREENMRGVSP